MYNCRRCCCSSENTGSGHTHSRLQQERFTLCNIGERERGGRERQAFDGQLLAGPVGVVAAR